MIGVASAEYGTCVVGVTVHINYFQIVIQFSLCALLLIYMCTCRQWRNIVQLNWSV